MYPLCIKYGIAVYHGTKEIIFGISIEDAIVLFIYKYGKTLKSNPQR